jgi:dTDP-4-amino-4,6-dideoxygalactose transaminase
MIQLFKVRMSENASEAVGSVLQSGFVGQGPKVEEFEDALHSELKTSTRPVTVNSCTSAIDLALHLCGVGPGDEVISTPQTCFASQVGAIHRGAIIRWADIDPITGLIDVDSVKALITKKTKAILAVNWAGRICDFSTLKSFGVPVIEDAAHTWDTFLESPVVRGDYICYSLQAIKLLTSGDGGILVCPTKEKEEEARILRWFGLDRTKGQSFRCTQNITSAGFKYHMNDINATIGLCNIELANDSVLKHRKNSKFIIDNVKNVNLTMPTWDDTCSFWLFSMHVKNNQKQHFTNYLESKGIASSPVHYRNDMYDCTLKFKEKDLPGVTSFDKTQICIPNGWWLLYEDLNYIVNTLNEYKE